jgi:hypothetical protein
MVGSAFGWREAPYLPCPADLHELADSTIVVRDSVSIVPGMLTICLELASRFCTDAVEDVYDHAPWVLCGSQADSRPRGLRAGTITVRSHGEARLARKAPRAEAVEKPHGDDVLTGFYQASRHNVVARLKPPNK